MAEFSPSQLSARNNCGGGDYGSAAAIIGPAISAVSSIATTVIGASSSKKGQAAQIKHEQELADKQAELMELQIQSEKAKIASVSAGGVLETLRTKRTMVLAGFGVVSVSILAGTAILIFRRPPPEVYEGDEYEVEE